MPTHLPVYDLTLPGPTVAVKTFKGLTGQQGRGYDLTLTRDGLPAGTVTDYADGGAPRTHFTDRATEQDLIALAAVFPAGAGVFPAEYAETDGQLALEWMLAELATHEELRRKFNRAAATKTVFLLDGQNPTESYHQLNTPFDARVEAHLLAEHGPNRVRVWIAGTGWRTL